jgi:anti-anti-sigma regulatory factor
VGGPKGLVCRPVTAEFSVSAEQLATGGLVVHVQGQVDLYAAPDLKARLLDAIAPTVGSWAT